MTQQKPTESELEILQLLWKKGPLTVRLVHEQINAARSSFQKEKGYTTVLKIMQIMAEKGLVIRDTSQKIHVYEAAVQESDTQKKLLKDFVNNTFDGAAMKLVMQTLGQHKASKEELSQIKALIDKLESEQKKF